MSSPIPTECTFQSAVDWVSSTPALSSAPTQTKLDLYAYYKLAATSSRAPLSSRPGFWDPTGRAKWDAWERAGRGLGEDAEVEREARRRYVGIVKGLGWEGEAEGTESGKAGDGNRGGPKVSVIQPEPPPTSPPQTLHDAAVECSLPTLLSLLASNPSAVNDRSEEGYTALHLAADRGHGEVVDALLRAGADRNLRDEDGYTARELAEMGGHAEVVRRLDGGA